MIKTDQIEDWIREIEQRPMSAGAILRSIASRLVELDHWNNELLTDNIELRSGAKVEEYESRIAALEYQLEMIKRQVGSGSTVSMPDTEPASLVLFNPPGRVLRLSLKPANLVHGQEFARFATPLDPSGPPPGMIYAGPGEELLFVFNSGRTVAMPISQIAFSSSDLGWEPAHRVDPRPGEELVAVMPISHLAMYEYCVQISRRGCAKLMPKSSFQSLVARGSIGAGVKQRLDITATLVFCAREGKVVLATHEGFLIALPAGLLPYTVDEVIQLSSSDYIVSAFNPLEKSDLIVVTTNGKAITRETSWLELAASFKSRGQGIYSPARREAGVRVAGAAAVNPDEFTAALRLDGSLILASASALISSGVLEGTGVAAFTALNLRKTP